MNNTTIPLVLAGLIMIQSLGSEAATIPARISIQGKQTPTIKIALDRLQQTGGLDLEVVEGGSAPAGSQEEKLTILLGTGQPSGKPDAYRVTTLSKEPRVIIASGNNERGMLYAAYHLADLLKAGADLSSLDVVREPRIAERYVSFGATKYGRKVYDPEQHWRTLNELPAFGYNGMIIYPGGGTPIGRRSSPIMETRQGKLYLDPENTRQWKAWFNEIRKYQLDMMMTLPPLIPPGYDNKEIHEYYAGGPEPKGYVPALKAHFRGYLQLLTTTYPEPAKYMFNSTEGATFGRNARFFIQPNTRLYSRDTYLENNEKVMKAYFDVLTDFFKDDLGRVYFWTHSFGLTSDGIAKMREVLFQYPEITIIEDDFWNNNLWPFDLPAMAYLPPDLRKMVSAKNPFALFQIATDGEYYGGGSLPNAYAGSHIRSAKEALDRNARMVIQRLDLHDRTPQGTAFGTMKIVPYAASKQLWQPTPSEEEIWLEWAETRFSKAAAPHVIRALQESHTILINGVSCNGIDLLAVGSEFNPRHWIRDGNGLTRLYLFGKPGRKFVDKQKDDVIYSPEYTAWQMNTRSISIREFRQNQEKALQAIRRGLEHISKAKPHLTPADHEMLRSVFLEGDIVLKALRLVGEAAYAANLLLDNFDNVPNPKAFAEKAFSDLEGYLAEEKLLPEMKDNLRLILADYRKVAAEK
jgi:hypothetical protein